MRSLDLDEALGSKIFVEQLPGNIYPQVAILDRRSEAERTLPSCPERQLPCVNAEFFRTFDPSRIVPYAQHLTNLGSVVKTTGARRSIGTNNYTLEPSKSVQALEGVPNRFILPVVRSD